jgi:hypothetical protein
MDIHNCSIEPGGYMNNGKMMKWCRFFGACSLGVPKMIEHYQKRVGASRYLNYCQEHEVV